EALPADERQFRPPRSARGEGEEDREAGRAGGAGGRGVSGVDGDAVKAERRKGATAQSLVEEFLAHLEKERDHSPHTVKAYRRDLEAFTEFCDRFYGGAWSWDSVDRLGVRGFLG